MRTPPDERNACDCVQPKAVPGTTILIEDGGFVRSAPTATILASAMLR